MYTSLSSKIENNNCTDLCKLPNNVDLINM